MAGKRKRGLVQYGKRHALNTLLFNNRFVNDNMFFPPTNDIDQSQRAPPLPPNKPVSQKAATMASQPSEGDIDMLMAVTSLPRSDAIRYLKVSTRDYSKRVQHS